MEIALLMQISYRGISLFGFLALAIAPAPAVFYYFGQKVRERFHVEL
jgi:hypothetical protein